MCIGIIDIEGNENLQRFSLNLSSFRILSIVLPALRLLNPFDQWSFWQYPL